MARRWSSSRKMRRKIAALSVLGWTAITVPGGGGGLRSWYSRGPGCAIMIVPLTILMVLLAVFAVEVAWLLAEPPAS
jgi:hypothetical protein